MRIIRTGQHGEEVGDVQRRLIDRGSRIDAAELDGTFGLSTEAAVKAFQQSRGLLVDGRVGPETWGQLVEAGYRPGDRTLYLRARHFRGDDVRSLQRRLNALGFDAGREDGIFGRATDDGLREFQRNVGHEPDGIVGPETHAALGRLRPPLEAPSRAMVREEEAVRSMSTPLAGARIAVDPGHGPGDAGSAGTRITEAQAVFAIAEALAKELEAIGAVPTLLRGPDENPSPSSRSRTANELDAAVCISLHLNGHRDPGAEGTTCFYFGTTNTHSPAGQLLAERIQEELVTKLGLMDGRTHPLAIAMLRETRMPAVQIEPCFITNPKEEQLLREPEFRQRVAYAIAGGVRRYFERPEEQQGRSGPRGGAAGAVSDG